MSDDKPEAEKPEVAAAAADPHAPASESAKDPAGSVTTTETTPTRAEASELEMATGGKPDEPIKDAHHSHGSHGDHAQGDGHGHGLAHTMPLPLLFGVLGALLVLTVATVAVTSIDLGAQGNLLVAMVIATIKAILVCAFFMHLLWDKKFNLVLFLTSVLFLVLFLSMTTTDRGEYQHLVDEYRAQQLGTK